MRDPSYNEFVGKALRPGNAGVVGTQSPTQHKTIVLLLTTIAPAAAHKPTSRAGEVVESIEPNTPVDVIEADLNRPDHQRDVLTLTAAYALDPMGNGGPLPPEALEHLIPGLKGHPTTLIFLAYKNGHAIGLATCFRGFSTFAARPLINIHDLVVLPDHRGMGIGHRLLSAVEQKARETGCCKVTLEVQENNAKARHTYEQSGFTQALYSPTTGGSLYYWKTL